MTVKNEHIEDAERILLNNCQFEETERVPFIKNMESCDLLAVPGSGKTTVLLAKLYCLSKTLDSNTGILVLSHTNAAIDEIENKLKPYCPNLFEYPNFIGTVQSFVNKFLVFPYLSQVQHNINYVVDEEIYMKEMEFELNRVWSGPIAYLKNKDTSIFYKSRFWFDENGEVIISKGLSQIPIEFPYVRKWDKERTSEIKHKEIRNFITTAKTSLIKKGILHYDDCYFLANRYIFKYPHLKTLLRNRFNYVFVDEMQDLEGFQIELLDRIFFEEESSVVFQRIGDINQAIYSSGKKVKVLADWKPRNELYLTGSNRLTKEVADLVNYFTLDPQNDDEGNAKFLLKGLRNLEDPIKPHLILFNETNKEKLKDTFKDIIKKYALEDTIEGEKYGFKIIGWSANWREGENPRGNLRLENIFNEYKKEQKSSKETFNSLSRYLQFFNHDKITLEPARKTILNALIHILRIEKRTHVAKIRGHDAERYFTKSEMIKFIQNMESNKNYELFKDILYKCSIKLMIDKDYDEVYNLLKDFILTEFKEWFDLGINEETASFIGENFVPFIQSEPIRISESDDYDIEIEINTVHSAKGQTHCATMYVETYYHEYETKKTKIENCLKKELHNFQIGDETNKRGKEALKMMYVGFSRPTHLLCYAMLKENLTGEIKEFEDAGWEIVEIE